MYLSYILFLIQFYFDGFGFFFRVNGFNRSSIFLIRFFKVFFGLEIGESLYDTSPCTISLDDGDDLLLVLGERDGGERDGGERDGGERDGGKRDGGECDCGECDCGDGDDTFLCFKLKFVLDGDDTFVSDIFLKRPVFL